MKTMLLFLVLVVGTTNSFVQANENLDQDEIRSRVSRGELLSLESILLLYPAQEYGKLIDLEVEREHGIIIYELQFLHADGHVIELQVDARNGQLLKQELEQ